MESLRWARLGALAMDDGMCTRQAAADCFRAVGVDVRPARGAPWPVEEHYDRGTAGRYPVAAVGGRSRSGCSGVGGSPGGRPSSTTSCFVFGNPLHLGVFHSFSPAGL